MDEVEGIVATDATGRTDRTGSDRRSFLRSSRTYAGAAALVGVPAAVLAPSEAEAAYPPARTVANPKADPPTAPVMAFVQDAKHGTVVIVNGEAEHTVVDHELVHRLLVKPPRKPKRARKAKAKHTAKTGRRG